MGQKESESVHDSIIQSVFTYVLGDAPSPAFHPNAVRSRGYSEIPYENVREKRL